ncbi:MAG: hypothetical protein DRN14_04855 [Thermoplasmata archaeon]|nr:MAG: hypothetical protein DRN14_04855 [Thermoplasmata archaeon]
MSGVNFEETFITTNAHFLNVITAEFAIANRDAVYALIINSITAKDTTPLNQRVGTDEAKKMTASILFNITAPMAVVKVVTEEAGE